MTEKNEDNSLIDFSGNNNKEVLVGQEKNIIDSNMKGAKVWTCPSCKHAVYEGDDDTFKPVGIAMGELPLIICVKCNSLSVSDATVEALTTAMKQAASGIILPNTGARV